MEIRFQPALLQEVIDSFSEKTEREGDPTYYNEFHEMADPIYEKYSLDDREPEFKKLYQQLFGKWGFADILNQSFDEFPVLKAKIGIVLVRGVLKEDQDFQVEFHQQSVHRLQQTHLLRLVYRHFQKYHTYLCNISSLLVALPKLRSNQYVAPGLWGF